MNFDDIYGEGREILICEHCNGYGSSLKEEQERCSCCNGTGVQAIAQTAPKKLETQPETDTGVEKPRRILWNKEMSK
jgi:hypothetical protein